MKKVRKESKKISALSVSLFAEARINIMMIFLALLIMGLGVYLTYHPQWTLKADIRDYNQGVSDYRAFLSRGLAGPFASSPLKSALSNFEKACLETTDKKLKSLALYNLGTIAAKSALDEQLLNKRHIEITEAVTKLANAIRNDPDNEDAKFNKELLDRILDQETAKRQQEGEPGPGYSPGTVEKGF